LEQTLEDPSAFACVHNTIGALSASLSAARTLTQAECGELTVTAMLCLCLQVWEAVSPRLQDKPDVLEWLKRNTAPLRQQLAANTAAAPAAAAMATA